MPAKSCKKSNKCAHVKKIRDTQNIINKAYSSYHSYYYSMSTILLYHGDGAHKLKRRIV
jgi:hypothetical protein